MSPKSLNPTPGQSALFETEGLQTRLINPTERHGIISLLSERYLGRVALDAFTAEDLELVEPAFIESVLFTASSRPESRHVGGVAVNAAEASVVPWSVNNLTLRVSQRTDNSRQRKGDMNAERRQTKMTKAKVKTLEGYLGHEEGVLKGLEKDEARLEGLKEALRHRELNRGHDINSMGKLRYITDFIFKNMINVTADELQWDNSQRKRAWEAFRYQMAKSPKRLDFVTRATQLADKYTHAKKLIIAGKYSEARNTLAKFEEQQ